MVASLAHTWWRCNGWVVVPTMSAIAPAATNHRSRFIGSNGFTQKENMKGSNRFSKWISNVSLVFSFECISSKPKQHLVIGLVSKNCLVLVCNLIRHDISCPSAS